LRTLLAKGMLPVTFEECVFLTKKIDRWGSFLLGTIFLLWFLLLHAPRVVMAFRSHDPNAPNEWSSAFIGLAMCGGSWICAWYSLQRRRENVD
jgi:hypothetical protein